VPGLSLVCSLRDGARPDDVALLGALGSVPHTPDYHAETLRSERAYFLGCTRYGTYPVECFDCGPYWICFEGRMYGKEPSALRSELIDLARRVLGERPDAEAQARDWVRAADGDFVVFLLDRGTSEIVVLSDLFGRLPLYYHESQNVAVLSREAPFVAGISGAGELDRVAIAQSLLFGYPLGSRQLLKGVSRVPPAMLLRVGPDNSRVELSSVCRLNFDTDEHAGRSLDENARELASLFCDACARRARTDDTTLVSLSGGLDSRTVAGALHKNGNRFAAVSYSDSEGLAQKDVALAEQIARVLDADWRTFSIGPPLGSDLADCLSRKPGLGYLRFALVLLFIRQVAAALGSPVTMFTGDGGDKALPSLRPRCRLHDVAHLAEYLMRQYHVMPPEDVSELTGLHRSDLTGEIAQLLDSYPEEDLGQKCVHFLVHERGMKWLFEAEDLSRSVLWTVTPFYSPRFFDYAMNCPGEQKALFRLYRAMLGHIAPELGRIVDPTVGAPFMSRRHVVAHVLAGRAAMFPAFWRLVRRAMGSPLFKHTCPPHSPVMSCLRDQLQSCDQIGQYLSRAAVERFLCANGPPYKVAAELLLSVTSAIERVAFDGKTLARYADREFD